MERSHGSDVIVVVGVDVSTVHVEHTGEPTTALVVASTQNVWLPSVSLAVV